MPARVDIAALIDRSKISAFQVRIFILCSLSMVMDGFDVQALGYVAPAIIQEWGIPNAALGPVFGATNIGFLIGSLLFSMLADKIGRRPVLIGATLFFSVMTIWTARAATVQELLVLRFISGIGLGSIIPNATALVGEYSPIRKRITLMMVVAVGFNVGAALGGFLSASLIPTLGWRWVFYIGGIVPFLLAVTMYFSLPESMQFLVLRKSGTSEKIGGWLKRIDPAVAAGAGTEYVVREENREGVPVAHLFKEGRSVLTILLWIVNFMNLLNLYSLASWLPTVIRDSGFSTSSAVLVGTILQMGGVAGTFGLAWLISKRGFVPVLTASFAIACIGIALIGQPGLSLGLLSAVVFVTGWCVVGGQPGINALAASSYPTYLRSTGIGWGLGVGRIGAIIGPVLGGEFMRLQWSAQQLFLAAALPALISAIVMFSMRWTVKPQVPLTR